MSGTHADCEYLKIAEAARLLGVARRTIYRRVWNGELPATRVGGLYLIRRTDLDALLAQGKLSAEESGERCLPALKCGYCYRMIENDAQIGAVCASEGCTQLICSRCLNDGNIYCVAHFPKREQRWQEAQARHQNGEIPLLLRASAARLREMSFLGRIHRRLSQISTLIHPLYGEAINIAEWETLREQGDERAEIMHLLSKVMLDANQVEQIPLNAWMRYRLPLPKGRKERPLEIAAYTISRLGEMLRDGFDVCPLQIDDLSMWLVKLVEQAQRSQIQTIVVLAATTGWDAAARLAISGSSEQFAFANPFVQIYLFDLERRDLLYNLNDDRARQYAELFRPLLPTEERAEAVTAIEKELVIHDSLTLAYAAQTLPYPETVLQQAFEVMAQSGKYALIQGKELGLAIIRSSPFSRH